MYYDKIKYGSSIARYGSAFGVRYDIGCGRKLYYGKNRYGRSYGLQIR